MTLLQTTDKSSLKISKYFGFIVKIILTLSVMSLDLHAIDDNVFYVGNVAHDGFYISDEQLAFFETESKLVCLMLCKQNERCQSFSYNYLSMKCQHFLVSFCDRPVSGISESGWLHYDPFEEPGCNGLYEKQYVTGIFTICPGNFPSFLVKCEMDDDGGGWTVIQQRFDGTVDFKRTWVEYKTGFGDLKGEFWLGNDQIHAITSSADYEIRIDISDWHGNSWYALYKTFKVGDESSQYKLTIGNYSGTAGDNMAFHNEMKFSTMDRDNDLHVNFHCSKDWGGNGGWWYNACDQANLNSLYGEDIGEKTGTEWAMALADPFTLKITRMMIRRL